MDIGNDLSAQAVSNDDGLDLPDYLDRNKPKKTSWRDILPVHPACEAFPDMSHAELIELGNDIKQNGLAHPVLLLKTETDEPKYPTYQLLDGKNRHQILLWYDEPNKEQPHRPYLAVPNGFPMSLSGREAIHVITATEADEIKTLVRSLNEQRRHLTAEKKLEAVEKLLKLDPTKSDRQIAEEAKSNRTTVGQVRAKMEKSGDVSIVDTRKDSKGRKQPAKKAKRVRSFVG